MFVFSVFLFLRVLYRRGETLELCSAGLFFLLGSPLKIVKAFLLTGMSRSVDVTGGIRKDKGSTVSVEETNLRRKP